MVALVRSAALTDYADLARSVGLDPVRMVRGVGIAQAALADPDLKIPASAIDKLLEASAARSGLEDFGLRLARKRRLSNLGGIGLVLREQPTMRRAIDAMMRLSWLQNESLNLRLEESDDLAILHCGTGGGSSTRQSVELVLAVMVRTLRALLGESWRPQLICFPYAPPRSRDTHRRVFNCELAFDQEFAAVVCARRDLDMPIPNADPIMAREVARYVEKLGHSPQTRMTDKVGEIVFATLSSGQCKAERLSETLGFDRRTLHRKLAQEETSFHAIVDDVRRRLLGTYMKDDARSLTSVAELLGFSSLSAFSRWHRHQFGHAPSRRLTPRRRRAVA